jgi:uncharacterized protein (DUF1330 family)
VPKGYISSAHRSEADPVKKAAYNLLAKDALKKAGGKIIAMVRIDGKLTVYENGIKQSIVLIEFNSYNEAKNAYQSSDYQKALLALDNGADRDIRIFEGV